MHVVITAQGVPLYPTPTTARQATFARKTTSVSLVQTPTKCVPLVTMPTALGCGHVTCAWQDICVSQEVNLNSVLGVSRLDNFFLFFFFQSLWWLEYTKFPHLKI